MSTAVLDRPAFAAPAVTAPRQLDRAACGDHLDTLFRVAMVLARNRADAEDLVQETYAKVLAKPRLVRNQDDLGYLIRALYNVNTSNHRKRRCRPATAVLDDDAGRLAAPERDEPEARVAAREVLAAIAQLPEAYRAAVAAVDVAGLSYAQAGRLIGVKEATITTRVHRGRRQLARQLGV